MTQNDSNDMAHDMYETPVLGQADFDTLIPGDTAARYNHPVEWLCLPKKLMPALVAEFVKLIETEQSNKYCSCEWILHPKDVAEGVESPRMMLAGEAALDCMVHTKEGFILGFTHWLFYMRSIDTPSKPVSVVFDDAPQGVKAAPSMTEEEFAGFMERWQEKYGGPKPPAVWLPYPAQDAGMIVATHDDPSAELMIHEGD